MIIDDKGQMSVEVLFLFSISLIVLIAFTIPLAEIAISNTLEVLDVFDTDLEIKQLANGIDKVYSQGMGAKQVETIEVNKDISVFIKSNSISTHLTLNDGKLKTIAKNHKADNVVSTLKLDKGVNKVLISWAEGSENIVVKKL